MAVECKDPRQSYLPASFKGVPFVVEDSSDQFGRRVAEYEYPLSNVNGTKDMGRKIRRFKLTGYVIGNAHVALAAACIVVAETPGPGLLIHPTLGPQIVACVSLNVSYSYHDEAGMARLDWEFIEALESNAPFLVGMAIGALFALGNRSISASYRTGRQNWTGSVSQQQGTTRVSQGLRNKLQKQSSSVTLQGSRFTRQRTTQATYFQHASESNALETVFEFSADDPTPVASEETIDLAAEEALLDAQSLLDRGLYSSTVYDEFDEAANPIVNGTAQVRLNFMDALTRLRLFNVDVLTELENNISIEPLAVTSRLAIARDYGLTAIQSTFATVGESLGHLDYIRGIYDEEEQYASQRCYDELATQIANARAGMSQSMLDSSIRLPGVVTYDANGQWPSLVAAQHIYGDGTFYADLENYNPASNVWSMDRILAGPANANATKFS